MHCCRRVELDVDRTIFYKWPLSLNVCITLVCNTIHVCHICFKGNSWFPFGRQQTGNWRFSAKQAQNRWPPATTELRHLPLSPLTVALSSSPLHRHHTERQQQPPSKPRFSTHICSLLLWTLMACEASSSEQWQEPSAVLCLLFLPSAVSTLALWVTPAMGRANLQSQGHLAELCSLQATTNLSLQAEAAERRRQSPVLGSCCLHRAACLTCQHINKQYSEQQAEKRLLLGRGMPSHLWRMLPSKWKPRVPPHY